MRKLGRALGLTLPALVLGDFLLGISAISEGNIGTAALYVGAGTAITAGAYALSRRASRPQYV